jgi:hypothetical protein
METSCIAMIEAIRSGCIVIHPSYGVLPETSSGVTVMYDMHENVQVHAKRCYEVTRNILLQQKENPELFNQITANTAFELPRHDISSFTHSWNNNLAQLTNE